MILTAFVNKYPLNSFIFLNFINIKNTKPNIDICNIKIVYHCILQVHSNLCAGLIFTYVATALTSFICCKARLATKVLSFFYLHIIFITIVVTSSEIIAVTNRKTSKIQLLKKKFLLGNSNSVSVCLSCKSKISFFS